MGTTMKYMREGNGVVAEKVQRIEAYGNKIDCLVLEECNKEGLSKKRKDIWIKIFSEAGAKLFNKSVYIESKRAGSSFHKASVSEKQKFQDLLHLSYSGDYETIRDKFGMSRSEFIKWRDENCPPNSGGFDELEGFED